MVKRLLILALACMPLGAAKAQSSGLESALECKSDPNPTKTILELRKLNLIERKAKLIADSVSYFAIRKQIKVWGLPVVYVLAYDEDNPKKVFERDPGTSPGTFVGVGVSATNAEVETLIKKFGSKWIWINEPNWLDDLRKRGIKPVGAVTEVRCMKADVEG